MYEHSTVIDQARKLGFNASRNGICCGLTIAWIIEALSSQEDNFYEPIKIITTTPNLSEVVQKAQQAKKHHLTEFGQKILALPDFFTRTLLCQNPSAYKETLGQCFPQLKLQPLLPYIETDITRAEGGIVEIYSEPLIKVEKELTAYFEDLRQIIIDAQNLAKRTFPVAMHLGSYNHSIGVRYDRSNDNWIMMNAGNMPYQVCGRHGIASQTMLAFKEQNLTAFNINVFITKKNIVNSTWFSFSKSIKEAFVAFRKKHVITKEIAQRKTCNNVTLAYIAALDGHVDVIKALVALRANMEVHAINGCAPIHAAVLGDQSEVITVLAQYKNQYTTDGMTPSYLAASCGYTGALKALAGVKADLVLPSSTGQLPAQIAAINNHPEIITLLGQLKIDVDLHKQGDRLPAYIAVANNNANMLHALAACGAYLGRKIDKSLPPATLYTRPVHVAVVNGHVNMIYILKQYNIDLDVLDETGNTPAYLAAQKNDGNMIRMLRRCGANIHKPNMSGNTPVHIAAQLGHSDVLNVLIEDKKCLDITNHAQQTPAHLAAIHHLGDPICLLYKGGANLNKANTQGITPAHEAALTDSSTAMRALAECHADLNKQDQQGRTPAYIAVEKQSIKIIDVLTEFNADFIGNTNSQTSPLIKSMQLQKWDIVARILIAAKSDTLLDVETLQQLNKHRNELSEEWISIIKTQNSKATKSVHLTNLLCCNNLLSVILNKPMNTVKFLFTMNRYRGERVTGSVFKIIAQFKEELDEQECQIQQSGLRKG